MELLTFYEFLVAMFMGLGAFCFFLWAMITGQMRDVEAPKHQVLRIEETPDES
ncbi:MAG TPA: cbb3-type cytochrome oxidase assembly protein CcoS [Candidatus Methylomirabilis sp.]|jgi:cbb3-type cytochrome oxidase maturation protein|nr:cbb3-type cytochrome oxidase assembly protein CcoS [Candidatus Methylomirabilis sp.]